jgi:S1-C subfamily serine protease
VVAPRDGNAAVVTGLVEGGAAVAAGFRNDDAILSLDGAPVAGARQGRSDGGF